MKIRSITIFSDIDFPLNPEDIASLGTLANTARRIYEAADFEVQTTRLATQVFPALQGSEWAGRPVEFAVAFEERCRDHGFEYISLGPVGEALWEAVPEILKATTATFLSTHLVTASERVIDGPAINAAARIIHQAASIEEGFGNLRFAALANVPGGVPFFPAAYHGGGASTFAIATESADLAVIACTTGNHAEAARTQLSHLIEIQAQRIIATAQAVAESHSIAFSGIDFSLAPFPTPEVSIGAALEALSGQPLGAAGTLAAAATLTTAIDQARFPHTGFCGLMLPVLEDTVLAQRAAEGRLHIGELLQWSAVCGTGLDTVPLAGDVSEAALARLLFDVAALSTRLRKPLTARLMPLPGKAPGDPVHFDFAYFADSAALALDNDDTRGSLLSTGALNITSRYDQQSSPGQKASS